MFSRYVSIATIVLVLTACAGTAVRKESPDNAATGGTLRVRSIDAKVSPRAKEQLPDNIKFDLNALSSTIERTLSTSGLQDTVAANTLDVEVTNVYVRGTFTAVMLALICRCR